MTQPIRRGLPPIQQSKIEGLVPQFTEGNRFKQIGTKASIQQGDSPKPEITSAQREALNREESRLVKQWTGMSGDGCPNEGEGEEAFVNSGLALFRKERGF